MNYIYSRTSSDGEETTLPFTAHPWLRGDGIFETIKTEFGQPFFLNRHLARAVGASTTLRFIPFNMAALRDHINILLARTPLERGRLRITIFSDGEYLITHEESPLRVHPHKMLVSPFKKYSHSMLSGIKSLSYGESAQGMRLATQKGCDDLLYFNEKNEVVEFGLANILIEREGKFLTPTLESGALAGVVRGILLEWFSSISEAVLTREDLKAADGVYVISSLREIVLVSELQWQNGEIDKYRISADAEKLRTQYLINSRSNPNS